jgi:hypothetical protein
MSADLFPDTASEPPLIHRLRNELERVTDGAIFVKMDVERTSRSEIYVKLPAGMDAKKIPQRLIEEECSEIYDTDWGLGADHDYSAFNAREVGEDEATQYHYLDLCEQHADQLRKQIAKLGREEIERIKK